MSELKTKEIYERSVLTITAFSEEDVIVTSGDSFLDDLGNLIPGIDNGTPKDDGNGSKSTFVDR